MDGPESLKREVFLANDYDGEGLVRVISQELRKGYSHLIIDLCLQALSKELFLTGLLDAAGLVSATACVFVEHKSDLLLHPIDMPIYEASRHDAVFVYEATHEKDEKPLGV
ncbi:hypothetical protein AGMMS50296_8630 [Alphaproteobacteria bacterium]|nr:hypothetical protein AGMMS50296_8630 [Alphaproteobacteria bacterium]